MRAPNVPRVSFGRESVAAGALAALACLLLACGGEDSTTTTTGAGAFDETRAFADVETMVGFGPRPSGSPANARQARFLAKELERAGLERVAIGEPWANVTGVIPGEGKGYIVLGAHHDTKDVPGLEGANDGASGAAVVLELARTLPNPMPGPGVAVALFDAEEARGGRSFDEDGTRGSRAYVATAEDGGDRAAGIPPLDAIRAMVLLDMVGDCDLRIPREASSDEALYDDFADAAGGAPFEGAAAPVLDDHVPFLEAGVPAVNLIDFTYGGDETPGSHWHTPEDTIDKVCPASLDAVGEAALGALPAIG